MARPIIIAHHLIWTAYGWWLPNDPRGGTSKTIACDVIAELGELHPGRKKVQPASEQIRHFYERAKEVLEHPLLTFDPPARQAIADAFAGVICEQRYTCYACAIMPDHVHVVIRKHKHQAEQMIENLQDQSRLRLRNLDMRCNNHPVWGGPGWKVFLDHPDGVRRTVRYVEQNPVKARMHTQEWPFVTTYDGWPLHPGHSPDSPYVRRLRAAGRYP